MIFFRDKRLPVGGRPSLFSVLAVFPLASSLAWWCCCWRHSWSSPWLLAACSFVSSSQSRFHLELLSLRCRRRCTRRRLVVAVSDAGETFQEEKRSFGGFLFLDPDSDSSLSSHIVLPTKHVGRRSSEREQISLLACDVVLVRDHGNLRPAVCPDSLTRTHARERCQALRCI